jgi:Na+-translocating ferredoxin:NAD+ oxidoreductase RnfE subunit
MHETMHIGILEVAVRVGLVLATALLFGIIFLAYLRLKNRKMLLISIGFGVFFVHALITVPELINDAYAIALNEEMHLFIPLIGLIFILLGILQD